MNSDLDISANGNNGLYTMLLLSRSVSIGLILIFFPLQIYSKKLKTKFLGHNTNLMLNSSANSLNSINLSINSILDLVFCYFNKSITASKSYAFMFNDFSSLINVFISTFISHTQIFSSILSSICF